jgi:hypothetical protein
MCNSYIMCTLSFVVFSTDVKIEHFNVLIRVHFPFIHDKTYKNTRYFTRDLLDNQEAHRGHQLYNPKVPVYDICNNINKWEIRFEKNTN